MLMTWHLEQKQEAYDMLSIFACLCHKLLLNSGLRRICLFAEKAYVVSSECGLSGAFPGTCGERSRATRSICQAVDACPLLRPLASWQCPAVGATMAARLGGRVQLSQRSEGVR